MNFLIAIVVVTYWSFWLWMIWSMSSKMIVAYRERTAAYHARTDKSLDAAAKQMENMNSLIRPPTHVETLMQLDRDVKNEKKS